MFLEKFSGLSRNQICYYSCDTTAALLPFESYVYTVASAFWSRSSIQ